jgi:hypothetical protein
MNLKHVFSNDFTLSKRVLGALMIAAGIAGFVGVLMIEVLDIGRQGGIGPSQRIALGGCVILAIIGATLLPLGKNPA